MRKDHSNFAIDIYKTKRYLSSKEHRGYKTGKNKEENLYFQKYDWDDINIEHIAKHNVTRQEVEEACYNQPLIMKTGRSRYLIYGRSDSGRYLMIVSLYKGKNMIRMITARDMTDTERRLYFRKRG